MRWLAGKEQPEVYAYMITILPQQQRQSRPRHQVRSMQFQVLSEKKMTSLQKKYNSATLIQFSESSRYSNDLLTNQNAPFAVTKPCLFPSKQTQKCLI